MRRDKCSPKGAPRRRRMMGRPLALGLAAAVIAGASCAAVQTIPFGPDLSELGWKELTFHDIPATSFKGRENGVLEIRADKSSSVLYRGTDEASRNASTLSWSWQVIDGIPATDLTVREGDDRNLSVHVAFAEPGLVNSFLGLFSPFAGGRALTYVWGGEELAAFPHPHLPDDAWIFVLRTASAPTGEWFMEQVDLKADFERVFGEAAPPVAAVGVSSDADGLGLKTYGLMKDLVLN